jgi:hypothetical protein
MPYQPTGNPAAGVEPSSYFLLRDRWCWRDILRRGGRSPVGPAAPVETSPVDDQPLWRDWDLKSGGLGCLSDGPDAAAGLLVETGPGDDPQPWRDWEPGPCELE